jgi:hypothetical protein
MVIMASYIIESHKVGPNGQRIVNYLTTKGAVRSYPFVFNNAGSARRSLLRKLNAPFLRDGDDLTVIEMSDLQRGLAKSTAKTMSPELFLKLTSEVQKDDKFAIYTIIINPQTGLPYQGSSGKPKIWSSAGALRVELVGRIARKCYMNDRMVFAEAALGLIVNELIFADDKFLMLKEVRQTPALDFCMRSKSSRARLKNIQLTQERRQAVPASCRI